MIGGRGIVQRCLSLPIAMKTHQTSGRASHGHIAYRQYGADSKASPVLVYFHGAPGAPEEAAIFDAAAKACGHRVLAFDRFAAPLALEGEAYFQWLAAEIQRLAAGAQASDQSQAQGRPPQIGTQARQPAAGVEGRRDVVGAEHQSFARLGDVVQR